MIRALKWLRERGWVDGYEPKYQYGGLNIDAEHSWLCKLVQQCTPAAMKAVVVLRDKTQGWGKMVDRISYSQFKRFGHMARSTVHTVLRRLRIYQLIESEPAVVHEYRFHRSFWGNSERWWSEQQRVQRGRSQCFRGGNGKRAHNALHKKSIYKNNPDTPHRTRLHQRGGPPPVLFDQDGYMTDEYAAQWRSSGLHKAKW